MPFTPRRAPRPADLARSGDFAALLDAAGHQSPKVRKQAIATLAELDPDEALPDITEGLRHSSDAVRCAAVRALYKWGESVPIATAVAWLPPRGTSRSLAFAAVAQLQQPESASVLAQSLVYGTAQEGLWEDEVEVVDSICRSDGGAHGRDEIVDMLIDAPDEDDDEVVGRAEDFLLWLGENAVSALIEVVQSASAPDRAVWLVGQIGGASVLAPLIEATEHPDARTREEACVALGELRDPMSVEALLRATRDSEHGVRVRAGAALESIGTAAFLAGVSTILQPQLDQPAHAQLEEPKGPPRLARPGTNGSAANGSPGNGTAKTRPSGARSTGRR
jgi:HEAT repeat protein